MSDLKDKIIVGVTAYVLQYNTLQKIFISHAIHFAGYTHFEIKDTILSMHYHIQPMPKIYLTNSLYHCFLSSQKRIIEILRSMNNFQNGNLVSFLFSNLSFRMTKGYFEFAF